MQVRRSSLNILVVIICILLSVAIGKTYLDLDAIEQHFDLLLHENIEERWTILETILYSSIVQSYDLADAVKDKIYEDIIASYDNSDTLAHDLYNLNQDNNPIIKAIANNIRNVYFHDIKNDNNDLFVATKGMVISDLSENCSALGRTRSFDQEIKMHANPSLASLALTRIEHEDLPHYKEGVIERPIFWQFLDSPHFGTINTDNYREDDQQFIEFKGKEAVYLETYDLKGLEKLFLDNGGDIQVFESFEFLQPSYLWVDYDLTGVPNVDDRGIRQNNRPLYIVSGFNFLDVLNTNTVYKTAIIQKEEQYKFIEREKNIRILNHLVENSLVFIIFFITFGIVMKYIRLEEHHIHGHHSDEFQEKKGE